MPRTEAQTLLPGLSGLLRKELMEARRSKRALIFTAGMTLILLLVPIVAYYNVESYGDGGRLVVTEESMDGMVGTWAGIVAYLGSLMVIASTVDAISHERSLGITAWIVTKPVSRLSYLLSKALAHAIAAAVTIVIVPSIFCILLMTLLFEDVPVAYVCWAMVILLVEMTFLSFCIVAIGVPLNAVVWVAVVALGLWFIPTFVPAIGRLDWMSRVLPSFLPFAAIAASQPKYASDSQVFSIAIASLVIGAVVFVASAALFERQEL